MPPLSRSLVLVAKRPAYFCRRQNSSRKLKLFLPVRDPQRHVKTLVLLSSVLIIFTLIGLFAQMPVKQTPKLKGSVQTVGPVLLYLPNCFQQFIGTKESATLLPHVFFGDMDERELCYYQFLGVFWFRQDAPDEKFIPSNAYRILEKFPSRDYDAGHGNKGSLTEIVLSAKKPCKRIVKQTFLLFRLKATIQGSNLAVAMMTDEILTKQRFYEILQTIKPLEKQ